MSVQHGVRLCTVDSGNTKRLNSKQSLIGETGRLFYNINYMLNSKHLSLAVLPLVGGQGGL